MGLLNLFILKEHRKKISANVMIVEDEKDLCYMLALILKKQNLSTVCANSISEARQTINRINPRILFVDNHLPDGSGTDFIGQVKSLYPAIKIIMITAYDAPVDVKKAFNNGADYFISKPFTSAAVKKALSLFAAGNAA